MPAFTDRTGEENIATNGQKMVITEYIGAGNITVQFEDGTIVPNKSYDSFKRGKIANPNFNVFSKVGESKIAYNGLFMKIIAYRGYSDIDVEFEDGLVVTTNYSAFRDGNVRNRNVKGFTKKFREAQKKYLGKKVETLSGICTVVEYNNSKDVTIEFEDGARVSTDIGTLKKGTIKNPNINENYKVLQMRKERLGKVSTNNYGYTAKIIEYNGARDFTIEFEDDTKTVVHNYRAFLDGKFKKPAFRLGEERVMNNGLKAKVIKYNSDDDMTVEFETGAVREGIIYANLVRGTVSDLVNIDRIDEQVVLYNGLKAEIIAYRDSLHIDIKLEDGTVLHDKQYSSFKRGGISHPTISNRGIGFLGSFSLLKRAYFYEDNVHYICYCNKCLYKDVLTPSEILSHVCKKRIFY